jgi:uncharacterized protein YcbK (DUF882 family)
VNAPGLHFTWQEFACHDGTPVPVWAHGEVQRLTRVYLEPLRRRFGPVTVISGFRTSEYNRRVGGAPHSYHVYTLNRVGVAADVTCRHGTAGEWARFLDELDVPGLGRYDSHVHADTRRVRARW